MFDRRNAWWSYRYLYASWCSGYLCPLGGRGSNACEQAHRTIILKNRHIIDYTMGLNKYIDEELCLRFSRALTRIKSLQKQLIYEETNKAKGVEQQVKV